MVKWLASPTRNAKAVSSNPGLTTALCVLEQGTLLDLLQSLSCTNEGMANGKS